MNPRKIVTDLLVLWTKCPKCCQTIHTKDIEKSNRCPKIGCGYTYPYSFAKAQELRKLLVKGTKLDKFSKLVLKNLDSIGSQQEKEAFLSKAFKLVLDDYDYRQMMEMMKVMKVMKIE